MKEYDVYIFPLQRNHRGGGIMLEGQIKKHKMVAPKGPISTDNWRIILRGMDKIEEICDKAEENLHASNNDKSQEIDL